MTLLTQKENSTSFGRGCLRRSFQRSALKPIAAQFENRNRAHLLILALIVALVVGQGIFVLAEEATLTGQDGIIIHQLESPFLDGINNVEVLLPETSTEAGAHRVLYVLPVEPGVGTQLATVCSASGLWGSTTITI